MKCEPKETPDCCDAMEEIRTNPNALAKVLKRMGVNESGDEATDEEAQNEI